MSKLILGVDGGGTKSHLALFDLKGKCVSMTTYGMLNHEGMAGSYAELEVRLKEAINLALDSVGAGMQDIAYAVLGVAGVDTTHQHKLITAMLERIGLTRFMLCNDSFLGAMACPGGVGICCINGTGTTIAAADHDGKAVQIAGLGGYTDDRGGAGWYAIQAVGTIYCELYKNAPATAMKKRLFDSLGITRDEEYLDKIHALDYPSLCKHNRLVFEAAAEGDEVAIDILKSSAEHFTGAIIHHVKTLNFPEDKTLYIILAGSVFVKEKVKILPEIIEKRVRTALGPRSIEFIPLDVPPVAGAIISASQKAGAGIGLDTVREELAGKL
jgi:N-acetylglucosamine kinase-like BadF-type ATPase